MSSIVERDLILRIIQQLAALVARVLKLKKERKYGEAEQLVAEAYRGLFGLDRRFLQLMQPAHVAQALGAPQKVKAFVELMAEEADLLRLRGDPQSAAASARWALEIFRAGNVPLTEPGTGVLLSRLRTMAAAG